MANMAMRQRTFISFLCCPEWRGLLTVFRSGHKKLMNVCCRIAMFAIYEDFN
jgi:uncharacterized protein YbaR (Trm112 family)